MRQKLGFRKENIIPWLIQGLIIFVFVYTILFWREVDKVQASMSIATLLTVLFLGKQLKVQNEQLKIQGDEFKKSLDIQEKRDKENEKKGLKEEMEQILCVIIEKMFEQEFAQNPKLKIETMDKFKNTRLFFLHSVRPMLESYVYKKDASPFAPLSQLDSAKATIEISKRYLRLEERFQQKFGGDEYHSQIAKILKDKLSFLKNA